jgi:hypothetical protein
MLEMSATCHDRIVPCVMRRLTRVTQKWVDLDITKVSLMSVPHVCMMRVTCVSAKWEFHGGQRFEMSATSPLMNPHEFELTAFQRLEILRRKIRDATFRHSRVSDKDNSNVSTPKSQSGLCNSCD